MKSKKAWGSTRGQTAVEYILTMFALLFVFTGIYKFLQNYTRSEFRSGAAVVVKSYK